MHGSTGFHHPKTKKEIAAMMLLEARSHANDCEHLATALRLTGEHGRTADALDKAARFIRHFTKSKALPVCSPDSPCCDRRDEYNGFGSGSLAFVCPRHCGCHD